MNRIIEKRILDEKEAAHYLGIGLTKFRYYDKLGLIPRIRYPENSSKRYDILDLDEWLDRLKSRHQIL
jgi:DNA-binding transcriptional MerR regulator